MAARAGLPATFAHEMGHILGVDHAPCPPPGSPGAPDFIDTRLPAFIEDIGLDVSSLQIIPAGRAEVMSYCDGEQSWPSIAFWNLTFDRFTLRAG